MDDEDGNIFYDLSEMSEDEKDEALKDLAERYNLSQILAVDLRNALVLAARRLVEGNKFGHRKAEMQHAAFMMQIVAAAALPALGVDMDRLTTNAQFEDIISSLEDDE